MKAKTKSGRREPNPNPSFPLPYRNDVLVVVMDEPNLVP